MTESDIDFDQNDHDHDDQTASLLTLGNWCKPHCPCFSCFPCYTLQSIQSRNYDHGESRAKTWLRHWGIEILRMRCKCMLTLRTKPHTRFRYLVLTTRQTRCLSTSQASTRSSSLRSCHKRRPSSVGWPRTDSPAHPRQLFAEGWEENTHVYDVDPQWSGTPQSIKKKRHPCGCLGG